MMTENEILKAMPGWEIVRVIGSGGFGKVYEIRKNDGFGDVGNSALKVISIPESGDETATYRDDGLDDESITALFKDRAENLADEFKLMSKLKGNSNIVSYEDHYIIPNSNELGWDILIRMELLTSLPDYYRDKYADKAVDEKDAIRLGIDICKALELCAKHKIIHRDIKPQNIFINANGDYKLGDFGVARTLDHATQATKAGTSKYMAPEVNKNLSYDASVDLYSLGLVLYWMLNERRLPFLPLPPVVATHRQEEEAISRRMAGEYLPKPAHAGDALHALINRACAANASDRFGSPTEMRQELEKLLSADTTVPVMPGDPIEDGGPDIPDRDDGDGGGVTVLEYLVRFLDEDGTVISSRSYKPGEKLELPPEPVRKEDGEYQYQFMGWVPQPEAAVRGNAQYTASYVREKMLPPVPPVKDNTKLIKRLAPITAAVAVVAVLLIVLLGSKNEKPGNHSSQTGPGTNVSDNAGGEQAPENAVWTDWMDALPADVNRYNSEIEVKTQYRSNTLHVLKQPEDGYTLYHTEVGEWGEWSEWSEPTEAVAEANEHLEVETSSTYYYRVGSYQLVGNEFHTATKRQWVVSGWLTSPTPVEVGGGIVEVKTETIYRTRSRTVTSYYTKDDSWGDYSDTKISPSDSTVVEMRCSYRYLPGGEGLSGSLENFTFSNTDYTDAFADVSADKWYGGSNSCMGRAVELGIFHPDSENKIHPEQVVSIAEVLQAAAIIHQSYCGASEIIADSEDFSPYIAYALENCLVNWNDFAQYNLPASRQEAAYILRAVLPDGEYTQNNTVSSIKDMGESAEYYDAVLKMIESGIVAWPEPDYSFKPEGQVSRAELATFVDRIVNPDRRSSNN